MVLTMMLTMIFKHVGREIGTDKTLINSVRCARCTGVFSLQFLDDHKHRLRGLYDISQDLASSTSDEW